MLNKKPLRDPDHFLALTVFVLVLFGWVMISSASAVVSYSNFAQNSNYFWLQGRSILVAILLWAVFQSTYYRRLKRFALPFFVICLGLLVAVFIPGLGASYGTSQSWISLPIIRSIQPAEFVKLGLIVYLAAWIEDNKDKLYDFQQGFVPFFLILSTVVGLLALQPDFGSVLVIVAIAFAMFFAAEGNILYLLAGGAVYAMGGGIVMTQKEYIKNRFLAFINPALDPEGVGYHIKQALIAVGSGGFWGLGFGRSRQKFEYLPEAQADSIFAVTAEELGFVRVVLLVLAFLFIGYKGFKIAEKAPDLFGRMLAVGITTWIVGQALLNIMVNLSLAPVTGITLPFISFGGSSLVTLTAGIGILLNISKYTETNAPSSSRRRDRRPRYSRNRRLHTSAIYR